MRPGRISGEILFASTVPDSSRGHEPARQPGERLPGWPEGQLAGIGAAWHDGDLYFTSGPSTRKARNLASNPACTIAVATQRGLGMVRARAQSRR